MSSPNNSDSVFLINLTATHRSGSSRFPGSHAPVNAFFSSDGNTAYVLNCGPECGSVESGFGDAFDIPSQTITATVPVGGASVGYLNGTTLYVAGSPVPPGTTSTYDAVNVSNMTRITANSVAIGDGFHTTMALATNNKLYIGANTCSNTTTGCLSVVDVGTNTADPPLASARCDHQPDVVQPQCDVRDGRRLPAHLQHVETISYAEHYNRSLFTAAEFILTSYGP